ncbi:16S rRNA (guanine(966)-N(2))-methyltransferase RsmD [Actinoalloteichus spitiensis]|uniref:16S rRNA (guanine(966)-N(2))-methyltransferase RsmD n=1 Tax=Actinoalloteichus spitiensis TaxID=252394 RepID=UPI000380FB37|nr:16S rRNA (guanine(966)-N(2))-methyltransferase RsmD [Actinoalloteichus spitiensis]
MTRIVAGTVGGRRIAVPPRGTRPTSERVREALFSALVARMELEGARVLDLYAGSGALGLEALSRGAEHVTFVEANRRAADVLRRNVTDLGLRARSEVVLGTVPAAVAGRPAEGYDLVLADPPYDLPPGDLNATLAALAAGGWVVPEGLLVIERAARSPEPEWPADHRALRTAKYGDTVLYWAERDG